MGETYLVVVGDLALVVGPEGVEETVVGAGSGGSLDAALEESKRGGEVDRAGEHRGSGAKGEEDGREGDHVDDGVADFRGGFSRADSRVLIYHLSIRLGMVCLGSPRVIHHRQDRT